MPVLTYLGVVLLWLVILLAAPAQGQWLREVITLPPACRLVEPEVSRVPPWQIYDQYGNLVEPEQRIEVYEFYPEAPSYPGTESWARREIPQPYTDPNWRKGSKRQFVDPNWYTPGR